MEEVCARVSRGRGIVSSINSPNISRLSVKTRAPCLTVKTSLVLVFVCLF